MAVETAVDERLEGQPIDLLVSLAEEGEIDPWDIDVVQVTDRFLSAVSALDRRGLKVCGETLLYASVLLRMKSEALIDDGEGEERTEARDWEPAPLNPLWTDPPDLEPPARRESTRPATLPELIEELENAARRCRLREDRERGRDEAEEIRGETVRELPHKERVEERISELSGRLRERLSGEEGATFGSLVENGDSSEKVSVFLPLLFMASRGLVRLEQEGLYGDIVIRPEEKLWTPDEEDD